MEFGILFTSHPNPAEDPYPHQGIHARVTEQVLSAEAPGYDTAWIAEHHFSTNYAGRNGFGLMLSTLPSADDLAKQIALYRRELAQAAPERRSNPAAGQVDIARYVYVAESDEQARADTEEAIIRHIAHFGGSGTAGHLGSVSEKGSEPIHESLMQTALLHGRPETVTAKLRELQARTGPTSLLLHYPPYYGYDKIMNSLRLFAEHVMPAFRPPARRAAATE